MSFPDPRPAPSPEYLVWAALKARFGDHWFRQIDAPQFPNLAAYGWIEVRSDTQLRLKGRPQS